MHLFSPRCSEHEHHVDRDGAAELRDSGEREAGLRAAALRRRPPRPLLPHQGPLQVLHLLVFWIVVVVQDPPPILTPVPPDPGLCTLGPP